MTADVRSGSSTAELVNQATAQVSKLVKDEIALAKIEMTTKAKRAGTGAGLFGGAGLLAVYGLGLLIALAVAALALVWSVWLAILVVAAAVFVIAGLLALVGKQLVKAATPPMPSEAVDGLTTDLDTVKAAISDGRQPS